MILLIALFLIALLWRPCFKRPSNVCRPKINPAQKRKPRKKNILRGLPMLIKETSIKSNHPQRGAIIDKEPPFGARPYSR